MTRAVLEQLDRQDLVESVCREPNAKKELGVSGIELLTTEGRTLRFDGELMARRRTAMAKWDDGARSVVLQCFAIDGGGYVVSLEYVTECEAESSCLQAERVDSMEDVEAFFQLYDPSEFYRGPQDEPDAERRRRLARLMDDYDVAVAEMMHEISEHPSAQRVDELAPPRRGWLRTLLGL